MDEQPIQNIQPEIQPQKPLSKTWQIAAIVVAGILVIGGVSYGSYYLWQKSASNSNQTACTMEAKQCEDGSYVGRTGPNCEFEACPSSNSINKTFILQGLQMTLPDKWSVKNQPSSIFSSASSVDIDTTNGSVLSLEIRVASPDEDIIELSKDSEIMKIPDGKIFGIACGGPLGCVGMIKNNNYYYIMWNGGSRTISDSGEITTYDNFTDQDVYDVLKTAKLANNPTAGWQTYKNEQYGFEVRYSNSAGLSLESSKDFGVNSDAVLEWNNSLNEKCLIGLAVLGWGPPFDWTSEKQEFSISGQKHERTIWKKSGKAVWTSTKVKSGDKDFSIDLKMPISGSDECLASYDQILSTFKFTSGLTKDSAAPSIILSADKVSGEAPLTVNFGLKLYNIPSCGYQINYYLSDENNTGTSEECEGRSSNILPVQERSMPPSTYKSPGAYTVYVKSSYKETESNKLNIIVK